MKYVRNDYIKEGEYIDQSEISDELAEVWIANGNKNVSDAPWPDLEIVPGYIVVPVEDKI